MTESGPATQRMSFRDVNPRRARHVRKGLRFAVALLAFILLFYWIGDVGNLSIHRPFQYAGDALEMLSYQTHDYVANDFDTRMRAPFEVSHPSGTRYLYNALFQSNSNLIWIAKLMGGGDAAMTLNLAYLLSFFLVFLSAYWACGRLGLRDPFRFCAATLFALMPYHFQRAENHFLESTYYFTPLLALILVQLWSARPLACRWRVDQWRFTWRDKRLWLVLFLLAFLSSFNPYHQFFFACLAASAAPLAALYRKSWRPLFIGWGLAFFACAVLVLKHSLSHHWDAPGLALSVNGMAIGGYGGAEMFPLKLTQLLLPVQGHRWGFLADLRNMYDAANPLNNENSTTTLGIVGGFGVVACVALALVPNTRVRMGRVGKVGLLTLMAILFASMGGLSSLISTISVVIQGPNAMLAQARGWDRIVVFVGFFAYFTAFWLLQRLAKRITSRRFADSKRPVFIWFVALIALAFALWDQVPYVIAQQHDGHYRSDVRFFGNLEKQLPPNSRVFQFPFVVHHYSGWVRPGVYYSDQLRPYINTRSLHFTYGGDLGSIQSEWLHAASQLPVNEAAPYLCRYGFAGILVQRNMLEQPATLELQWDAVLDDAPKVSDDADYAFFDLRPFCAAHSIHTLNMEAMKANLIAQLKNGQHFVPAGALEHKIGHAYLQSDGNVARRADANEAGWLAYGPYGRLRPGRYRAVFRVSSISNYQKKGSLTLDITGKSFGEQHTLNSIAFQPQSTPGIIEKSLDFDVTRYDSDMQYRVFKSVGIGLDFVGVEIRKIPQ